MKPFDGFRWVEEVRRARAIRRYCRLLPGLLLRAYGAASSYTPAQISQTIVRHGLSSDYTCYAMCMFTDRSSFDLYHKSIGEACDYDAMRAQIAGLHVPLHGDAALPPDFHTPGVSGHHHSAPSDDGGQSFWSP